MNLSAETQRIRESGGSSSVRLAMAWMRYVFPGLGDPLFYRPDLKKPTRHGYVEPRTVMVIAAYQVAIAATAPHWQ